MKKTSIVITLTTFAVVACILFAFAAAHRSVADARESARPSASQTGEEVLCSAARETDGAAIAKIPLLTVTGEAEYSAAADGAAFYGSVTAIAGTAAEAEKRCGELAAEAAEAFAPFGSAHEQSRSSGGYAGEYRAYRYYRFETDGIGSVEEARGALTDAGVNIPGSCEYSVGNEAECRTEALSLALENARKAAAGLGGGRLVRVEQQYCYADGYGDGKVTFRASVKATFVAPPREKGRPPKEPRDDDKRVGETEYENDGNVYIVKNIVG